LDSPTAHAAAAAAAATNATSVRGLQNIDNDAQQYLQPPVSRPFETSIQDDMSTSSRNTRRRLAREESPQSNHSMDIDILPPAIQFGRAREAQKNEYSSHMHEEGNITKAKAYK
jgi:hypothetical protein